MPNSKKIDPKFRCDGFGFFVAFVLSYLFRNPAYCSIAMTDNPYQSPEPADAKQESERAIQHGTFRWLPIVSSVAVWLTAYWGGSEVANGSSPTLAVLLLATISSVWVYHDAKRTGVNMVGSANFLIFFAWMISIPIYLIYTRGKAGWVWSVLQAACVCGAWFVGWKLNS